ncbi:MAG: glycosyltransferase family 2 protein, partial [Candidatus Peribacteraceae bacterium]
SLSVVLPCFNEERNIAATLRDVEQWVVKSGIGTEIVAVDDGSTDGTLSVLQSLQTSLPGLRIVRHEKNQGYGLSVRTGCDAAQGEAIAFMDSDGQFRAEDISRLLPHLDRFAFVTGRRRKRADPFIRRVFGKILGVMNLAVLGLWVRDVNCGMKVFRREIWPQIRPVHGVEKLFNTEMFLNLKRRGIPWYQVEVPHYPRRAGNPTGGSARVILRMFRELWDLKRRRSPTIPTMPKN